MNEPAPVRADERRRDLDVALVVAGIAVAVCWAAGLIAAQTAILGLVAVLVASLAVDVTRAFAEDRPWRVRAAEILRRSAPLVAGIVAIAIHEAAFGWGPQWLQALALFAITMIVLTRAPGVRHARDNSPGDDARSPF